MRSLSLIVACLASLTAWTQSIQTDNIDSLRQALKHPANDTSKIWAMLNIARNIPDSDTSLVLSEQALVLAQQMKFSRAEAEANNNLGYWYNQLGNYPRSLSYYLRAIKIAEGINYGRSLKRSYNSISTVYLYIGDYDQSLHYSRQARSLSTRLHDPQIQSLSAAWISKAYFELNRLDSAQKYADESHALAIGLNIPFQLYMSTARLGEIALKENKITDAISNFTTSLSNSKLDGRPARIAGAYLQLAKAYRMMNVTDSIKYNAEHAFNLAQSHQLNATLLGSSLLLSELFESKDDTQSLKYLKIALTAKDSLFSTEKSRSVAMMSFNEAQRQQVMLDKQLQDQALHKRNIQYAGIAIGVLMFAILVMVFSRTRHASEKTIRFLTTLALLIVFEFLNLLLDPYINNVTQQVPLLLLLALVAIAGLLIPVHQWLEHRIHQKLLGTRTRSSLS
ncbi:MAG: tetratricopeptide repeat protein [Chryseolinea sp.]